MNWDIDTTKGLATGPEGITFSYKETELMNITNIPQWVDHKDLYLMTKEANMTYLNEYKSTETVLSHALS
jgi:hypothetical protein